MIKKTIFSSAKFPEALLEAIIYKDSIYFNAKSICLMLGFNDWQKELIKIKFRKIKGLRYFSLNSVYILIEKAKRRENKTRALLFAEWFYKTVMPFLKRKIAKINQ